MARLDHFNICVPDVPRAYAYYAGLGFGLSETIEDEQTLYAAWMYRKQTVHDVAFTGGAGPRLHHLGFFAHEPHSVLRLCDILGSLSLQAHIERGPGRPRPGRQGPPGGRAGADGRGDRWRGWLHRCRRVTRLPPNGDGRRNKRA